MISTPVVWIFVPLGASIILWLLRKLSLLVDIFGVLICIILAIAAWVFPFSGMTKIGPFILEISNTFSVLGRSFVLTEGDRFLLIFLYWSF